MSSIRSRLQLPDWVFQQEAYIRKKSIADAKWTWRGDPLIEAAVWVQAEELCHQIDLMRSMDYLEYGKVYESCDVHACV